MFLYKRIIHCKNCQWKRTSLDISANK